MRNLNNELKNKTIDYAKLINYGFKKYNDNYHYEISVLDNNFQVIIDVSKDNMTSKVIDLSSNEEYIPVDIKESTGKFIGKIKETYENILNDIINKCTNLNIFKNKQTKEIIKYIKDKYQDDLEFLWDKYPDCAIWRNRYSNKWYGLLMTIPKDKLGFNSHETVEIIDLHYQKEKITDIVDNKLILPGYHMNKKSWITIILDESVDTQTILDLIDNSYLLSTNNKNGHTQDELALRVYNYLTTIPKGKVVTYGQVANYLGNKGLARVVGNILHKNPDGDKYPCYKVLNNKGELTESFVFGGKNIQKERLIKDSIKVVNNKVDLNIYQWKQ